jgi:hypothetical protein
MGLDAKTYWLTDRQSQCDFDFDLTQSVLYGRMWRENLIAEGEESPLLKSVTRKQLVKTAGWKGLEGAVVFLNCGDNGVVVITCSSELCV